MGISRHRGCQLDLKLNAITGIKIYEVQIKP